MTGRKPFLQSIQELRRMLPAVEAQPGTYALVLSAAGGGLVQIGRFGKREATFAVSGPARHLGT